jgi:hypothetical protein
MTVNPKLLPAVMIVIDVLAAVVYATNKDVRHTIYWLAAAVLTASVTF